MSVTEQPAFLDIQETVAGFGDLPTLAPVALEVLRLADDDRATLDDVADAIGRDPAIASQLLKIVNSPMYGMGGSVASLKRATSILGLRTVKLLSLSFAVISHTSGGDDTVWRRTLAGSALAQSFANRLEPRLQDECFIAALLANLGRLALMNNETYADASRRAGGWLDTDDERARFTCISDEISYEILLGWGLPEMLAIAIRHRSEPHTVTGHTGRMASLLRAADTAAGFVTGGADAAVALERWHHVAAIDLQLDEERADALLAESQQALETIADMFRQPTTGEPSVVVLLQRAREGLARLSLDMVTALSREQHRAEQLESENERLAAEAMTDPLTGLPNRRAFDVALATAVAGHKRGSMTRQLGVLVLDLDRFKSVNDTYGHHVGDDVLRAAAGRLRAQCREDERIARLGGEEFGLLLPSTDSTEISLTAERFRAILAAAPVDTSAGPIPVTTSIGAAVAGTIDDDTAALLMHRADDALYKAKAAGRDRTHLAS